MPGGFDSYLFRHYLAHKTADILILKPLMETPAYEARYSVLGLRFSALSSA